MHRTHRIMLGLLVATLSLVLPQQVGATVSASVVTTSGQLLSGGDAEGLVGDIALANDDITFIISAIGHTTHYGENGGTVIDAGTSTGNIDALGEFYTYFDDDWPRQAVYSTLTVVNAGGGGGPAVVRAIGQDQNNPTIAVVTDYSLGDGDHYLTITTSVTAGAASLADFELGDAFQWGSCDMYAPVYGYSVDGTTTQPWLAGVSSGVSYAYGGSYGDCWGPNGNGWSDLNVTTANIASGETADYVRFLAVSGGEIAAAVSILYDAMGTVTGTVDCTVTDQSSGTPIGGSTLNVSATSGEPLLQMTTDGAGLSNTSLPLGSWRIEATASGYSPVEQFVTVTAGSSAQLTFQLDAGSSGGFAIGDTITTIQRPLVNIPALVLSGDILEINCAAAPTTTGWQAEISYGTITIPLSTLVANYDASTEWWTLTVVMPEVTLFELYDLRVTADGGIDDTTHDSVRVLSTFRDDFYFLHITDTHLPDHQFSNSGSAPEDSTESVDLRAVIQDINLINPEFVLITGDLVNEGELEDYMDWRVYSRAQGQLYEFNTPTFLVSGNHDIGGWGSTPPPAGTARRDWWRFFGWPRLSDPPPGAPEHTQNYSFDYGSLHLVGLEAYNNYDMWLSSIYGSDSFPMSQLSWLNMDLAAASGSAAQVLFYHFDFQDQLNLNALGVEMTLWGHVHGDRGSISVQPYDLGTDNVCDGGRSYRLIRYSNGTLQPEETVSAGSSGQNLRVFYAPSNVGVDSIVTAQITNSQPLEFENGQLRFVMPAAGGAYAVEGGQLVQVDQSGEFDICYVEVNIQASSNQEVTVSQIETDVPDLENISALKLSQNQPNPFNPTTALSFHLPLDGAASLVVYDLNGSKIAVLMDTVLPAGDYTEQWDGTDDSGHALPSGVYLVQLVSQGQVRSRKVVLAR
jgi:hypothetical protein